MRIINQWFLLTPKCRLLIQTEDGKYYADAHYGWMDVREETAKKWIDVNQSNNKQ
ncbi:MAG: hypothetical protein Wins2KO_04050 [Winogradskyella sp.]